LGKQVQTTLPGKPAYLAVVPRKNKKMIRAKALDFGVQVWKIGGQLPQNAFGC